MEKATKGSSVSIHFTGKLSTGETFDTSRDGDPIKVETGAIQNRFPQIVVESIKGMKVGEHLTIEVKCEDGFGFVRKELILEIPKTNLDESFKPEVGQYYHINQEEATMLVKVIDVKEQTVTLDANHPLAGKNLVYDVELISIS